MKNNETDILLELVSKNEHWKLPLKTHFQLAPGSSKENFRKVDEDGHYIFKRDWRRDKEKGTMFYINKE